MKGLITAALSLLFLAQTNAQIGNPDRDNLFKGLFSAGMNIAQIDGDGPAGYNYFGAYAGVGTLMQFHKNMGVSLEMIYNMLGSQERRNPRVNPQTAFRVTTDYLQVPVLFNVNDSQNVLFSLGLAPGILVRNQFSFESYDSGGNLTNREAPSCLTNDFRNVDLSGIVGLQFVIKNNFAIGGRYSYSLLGLRPPCEGNTRANTQRHNVITLRFTYIL